MALVPMAKIMIVSYRGEAGDLLEALQQAGRQRAEKSPGISSSFWPG